MVLLFDMCVVVVSSYFLHINVIIRPFHYKKNYRLFCVCIFFVVVCVCVCFPSSVYRPLFVFWLSCCGFIVISLTLLAFIGVGAVSGRR